MKRWFLWPLAGLLPGALVGTSIGLFEAAQNRYFELGMPYNALTTVRGIANDRAVTFVVLATIAGFLSFLIHRMPPALRRILFRIAIAVIVAATFWLTAQFLRTLEWYPPIRSFTGLAAAMVLLVLFSLLAWSLLRHASRIYGALFDGMSSLSGLRPAAAACLILLIVNGSWATMRSRQDNAGWNVLLLTIDTLRADHLGCYGYVRDTSPAIDRFARESVLFETAIAQWPMTSPSFAAILTGQYGNTNGLMRKTRQAIARTPVLLAETLRERGWRTSAIITNGNLSKQFQFDQGFDEYRQLWDDVPDADAGRVTNETIEWLDRTRSDGKFFLWLLYLDPHSRYQPPAAFHDLYLDDEHYEGGRELRFSESAVAGIRDRARLGDETDLDYYVAQYDSEIRFLDSEL